MRTTCVWPTLLHPRRIARYFSVVSQSNRRGQVEGVVAFGDWAAGKRNTVQGGCTGTVLIQAMGDSRDAFNSTLRHSLSGKGARLHSITVAYKNPVIPNSWARTQAYVTSHGEGICHTVAQLVDAEGKLLVEATGTWIETFRHSDEKQAKLISSLANLQLDPDLVPISQIQFPPIPPHVVQLTDPSLVSSLNPLFVSKQSHSNRSEMSSAVINFGGLDPLVPPHEHLLNIYFITECLWGGDKITRGGFAAAQWNLLPSAQGSELSSTSAGSPLTHRTEFWGEYELGTGGFGVADPATARWTSDGALVMDIHPGFLFTLADTSFSNMNETLIGTGPTGTFSCNFPETEEVVIRTIPSTQFSGPWISVRSYHERQENRKAFLSGGIFVSGKELLKGAGVWIHLKNDSGRAGLNGGMGVDLGPFATIIRNGKTVQKAPRSQSTAKI
ncbi:hypothetical protein HDU93_002148 [Gonapodya sp. JEL0774]|nr:hypothetical protein HDU93_002148 [Gonapodya sp. JEL0774]